MYVIRLRSLLYTMMFVKQKEISNATENEEERKQAAEIYTRACTLQGHQLTILV